MKRNKLLRAFSLADEKYVAEADPTKENKKAKASLIRKCVLAACLCLIMTACNIALFTPYDTTPPDVSRYSDSEYYPIIEKLNALTYQKPRYKNKFEEISDEFSDIFASRDAMEELYESSGNANFDDSSRQSYTEITDNQVNGVIEGDRIKRSDKFIFYLDEKVLKSFRIKNGELEKVAQCQFDNNGRIDVWDDMEFYLSSDCRTITVIIPTFYQRGEGVPVTKIQSIRVTDEGWFGDGKSIILNRHYVTSRVIDGKLILISNYYPSRGYYDPTRFVPSVSENGGEEKCMPVENIIVPEYIPDSRSSAVYTAIYKLDEKTLEIEDQIAIFSYSAADIYMTNENLYATRQITKNFEEGDHTVSKRMTDIVCVSLAEGLEKTGEITVEGYLNNRYSLDEHNGILRVVTTTSVRKYKQQTSWGNTSIQHINDDTVGTSANLYCVSTDNWEVVAGVYQFAPVGETVRSVRYDGNMAYVCTAVQSKDPVFFFDLTDLNNIVCKDTGEIAGFSTSLVNFGDGYLLGIGQGADWGSVKIEIYRESETGVESVAVFEREGAYISENYKAYYIDRENQLLGLGISGYMVKENGAYVRQNNYLVLHFNRDIHKLVISAELPLEGSVDIMRGVYIDGYFHMFGNNDFKTVELK